MMGDRVVGTVTVLGSQKECCQELGTALEGWFELCYQQQLTRCAEKGAALPSGGFTTPLSADRREGAARQYPPGWLVRFPPSDRYSRDMVENAPVVIGNDGSDFADAALRKGLSLARHLQAPVRVVRAWTISTAPRPKTWSPGYVPPAEDFEAAVRERLEADTASIRAEFPDVAVTLETPHGAAGRELVKASVGAAIVVVGTRGLGGFQGLLLGSVSDQVTQHAHSDVLVVRKVEGDPAPGRRVPVDRFLG